MLEDETVHTGTQKSRVYCSLPWNKSLFLMGIYKAGRWSGREMNAEIVPPIHILTHSGRSRSGTAATCARWQGSRPASVPGMDSSVRPVGSLGGAVGVRWKQKETGDDQRTKDILVRCHPPGREGLTGSHGHWVVAYSSPHGPA